MERTKIVHILLIYQSQISETKPSSIIKIISCHIGAKSQRQIKSLEKSKDYKTQRE